MRAAGKLTAILVAVAVGGCYHATIETGLPPSPQTLENTFASSWIYGLVPPKTVEAASRCPNGVSRVETQLSFVNQLVGFITLGIYTPMSIVVTCASGGMDDAAAAGAVKIDQDAPSDDQRQQLTEALHAFGAGEAVFVQFE